ncbi:MAG: Coq4 family protein [Cyanobacteria bacterium P01_A01_bin.17]
MVRIKRFIQSIRDYYAEGQAGDIAFLKFKLLGLSATPEILSQLQGLEGYAPNIDLAALSQLPVGTFGYEYAQHMHRNGIHPLVISADLQAEAQQDPFALRYTVTHDMFHVLLGFDTSYAGEVGVFAFMTAQNYSKFFKVALPIVSKIYPLLFWGQKRQIKAHLQTGKALGEQAQCLLAYRLEDHWTRPLVDVRSELGLILDEGDVPEVRCDRNNNSAKNTRDDPAQEALAA